MFLSILVLTGCSSSDHKPGAAKQVEIAHVRDVLGLEYPYRIQWLDVARDGGTVGVILVDSWGRKLSFSVDGRLREVPVPVPGVDTIRMAPRHVFLGATHPSRKGARELPIGGREEHALIELLEVMSLDYFPHAKIESLATLRGITRAGMTNEETRVLRAGLLAWNLRHRDPDGAVIWVRDQP